MRCSDCDVNQGDKYRVYAKSRGWFTAWLCGSCAESRIEEGDTVEPYGDAWDRWQDEQADRELSER